MKRLSLGILALLALCIGGWQLYGSPQENKRTSGLKPFMTRKLEHSKSILEALARADFESMSSNAQALSLLSLESSWETITTQEYVQKSADFRRACMVIQEAAEEKNVDRATLGFVNLTVRCVECHSYLRKNALIPAQSALPAQP